MNPRFVASRCAVGCLAFCYLATLCWSQEYTAFQREQAEAMLRDVAADVKKHYYDPNFHGVDWDANVRETKEKIDKATSLNMALSHIAAALDRLHDSHTFFVPPPRPYFHDYGFQMQMIGDRCYATHVRPGSDAEAKGLKAGDEILNVNGYTPTRDDFWRLDFIFRILRPQPGLRLKIRQVSGSESQVDVAAKIVEHPLTRDLSGNGIFDYIREMENQAHSVRVRYVERADDLLIVKLPEFLPSFSEADSMIGKMKKHKGVILDLRGNPGGSEEMLQTLLGGVFENDVNIFERVTRDSTKQIQAKSHHHGFTGKLVVLIDSRSASASELVARVIQIEKRGVVLGDRSSGSVMEAQHYGYKTGMVTFVVYGASITRADLKMSDGHSLEQVGVNPDKLILPTVDDLATGRDPVISEAAEMLGVKITPEESGTFFPHEWPKE
jgi:C-terminal processing protease CtpA/Prc